MINYETFFDIVRKNIPIKHANEVSHYKFIIEEGIKRKLPLRWIAYMLATTYHETAGTMMPIQERGKQTYFAKYDRGTRLGRILGNTMPGDGFLFRGRGYVQITGRANYRKFGIDTDPDAALTPNVALRIMMDGMIRGMFTGRKLVDYFNDKITDWRNARKIINGLDRADTIAVYAKTYMEALDAATKETSGTAE